MSKPIVRFINTPEFFSIDDQQYARVYTIDHPKLGMCYVYTSLILNRNEDGSFETLNTIYKPYKDNNDPID